MSNPTERTTRTAKRAAAAVAAGTLVAGVAVIGAALPSQASLTTTCIGEAGAVTVPGDLVVPAGASCELSGTIVEGTTTVRAGSDLVLLDGAELKGEVTVARDAFLAAEESTVTGTLNLRAAFGGYFIDSDVNAVVDARNGSYVYSLGSTHAADVSSRAGELFLESSTVAGKVESRNDLYADVYDSTISGNLLVAGVTGGSLFCMSEVDGNAVYRDAAGDIQIGASQPLPDCGFNAFGKNVRLLNNTGDIQFSDNVVRGDLVCDGNAVAPAGEGNRVRGEASGQCADIQPAAAPMARQARPADRSAEVESKLQDRLEQAEDEAAKAGPADIG